MSFDAAVTEERERRRIASELHDGMGQTLALAPIKLGSVRSEIQGSSTRRPRRPRWPSGATTMIVASTWRIAALASIPTRGWSRGVVASVSSARAQIALLGGRLDIPSTPGRGTLASVRVPQQQSAAPLEPSGSGAQSGAQGASGADGVP